MDSFDEELKKSNQVKSGTTEVVEGPAGTAFGGTGARGQDGAGVVKKRRDVYNKRRDVSHSPSPSPSPSEEQEQQLIYFEKDEGYEEIDLDADGYYERSYSCLNCGHEEDAVVQDGVTCPKNLECSVCHCDFMNPAVLE